MKFNITTIELCFWRVGIIVLFIWCIILSQGNRQAQNMGLKNIELITQIVKSTLTTTIIETAFSEDYPPKKKLADREWCKDRSCLVGTGIE